jgi:Kef-type K+ transport system membrane component KefB
MPVLFSMAGSSAKPADVFDPSFMKKAIGLLLVGLIARVGSSMLATHGTDFSMKERIFTAISCCGKATVQGAMGAFAYDTAVILYRADPTNTANEAALSFGNTVKLMAVFTILTCGTVSPLFIRFAGPRMSRKDGSDGGDTH